MQIPELCGVDVTVKNRLIENVIPRQIAMSLMYIFSNMSFRQIGFVFDKDYATVLHAVKCMNNSVDSNDVLITPTLTKIFNRLYIAHQTVLRMIDITDLKEVITSQEVDRRLEKYHFAKVLTARWRETNGTKIEVDGAALASV